jgi:hypothetical protein
MRFLKHDSLYIDCYEHDWDGMELQWNRLCISVRFKFMFWGIAGFHTRVDRLSFPCWSVVELLTPVCRHVCWRIWKKSVLQLEKSQLIRTAARP